MDINLTCGDIIYKKMKKNYIESLPDNYFDNLYTKIKNAVDYEENTCIAVMYGQSNKTIYRYISLQLQRNNFSENVITYNQEIDKEEITKFVSRKVREIKNKKIIFIIRFLENIKNRRIDPQSYSGHTTSFFLNLIYISPFNFRQTKEMIETLKGYYGWKIPERHYKAIYNLSGGIARIIKYICKEINDGKSDFSNYVYFTNNIQINFELEYLKSLIINTETEKLSVIGLTTKSGLIKSALLRYHFNRYRHGEILKYFPYLSTNESKILTYLIINKSSISVNKISSLMKMTDNNFSLWAIYKIMSRLKKKVANRYNIRTIKNFGYALEKS